MTPNPQKAWWRYAASLAVVALSTAAAEILFRVTGTTRLSMVFLAGVLVVAFLYGSGPAYLAAGVAFLVYNFYLVEPRFSISFEAEDALNLAVFLAVAMLTGVLTGRIRDAAKRAEARAHATRVLFDATREFSASSDEAHIRERLAHHLAEAARGPARVGDRGDPLPAEAAPLAGELAEALEAASPRTLRRGAWRVRPLRADDGALGFAAWAPSAEAGAAAAQEQEQLIEILADAGATAISRAHLAAGKSDAETRARTEVLRNALLSSISHDLRTPLAAIMASASSLQEYGHAFEDAVRKDLAATIQEEAVRLDSFVANLLNMTRLEAGELAVHRNAFSLQESVERVLARRGSPRPVQVAFPPLLPDGLGDPVLFEQALGNVVENAARYSPPEGAITVQAVSDGPQVRVEVCDEGPGVPEAELERIFEKFYRCSQTARTAGTGLGLAIARGLMEGMGGGVEARNRPGAGGLSVTLTLPAAL
ncbi:ATP-binding protein [Phenylobacterium sp.]|uniref:ATP-binding protein n=1 Tax=Phenylobacterium sp. TaxID=1871053 RepID=UPI0035B122B4